MVIKNQKKLKGDKHMAHKTETLSRIISNTGTSSTLLQCKKLQAISVSWMLGAAIQPFGTTCYVAV